MSPPQSKANTYYHRLISRVVVVCRILKLLGLWRHIGRNFFSTSTTHKHRLLIYSYGTFSFNNISYFIFIPHLFNVPNTLSKTHMRFLDMWFPVTPYLFVKLTTHLHHIPVSPLNLITPTSLMYSYIQYR